MAEPTSAFTVQDLILRVAKAAGVAWHGADGQSKALIPVDEEVFERCLDCVNDGIKFFIASAPPMGWRWQNREATVLFYPDGDGTDNIDTDGARYQLSDDFQGEVTGPITYIKETGHGTSIDWVHEGQIRQHRQTDVLEGYPTQAAVRPYSNRTWELIVDPSPSAADTVTFPYRAGFAAMQAASGEANAGSTTSLTDVSIANLYPDDYFNGWTIYVIDGTGRNSYAVVTDYAGVTGVFTVADWLAKDGSAGGTDPSTDSAYFVTNGTKHPAGMQFDEAVLGACLAKAELEFEDLQTGYMDKFLSLDVAKAWEIDARSAPRKLGPMLPGRRTKERTRIFNDVTYT